MLKLVPRSTFRIFGMSACGGILHLFFRQKAKLSHFNVEVFLPMIFTQPCCYSAHSNCGKYVKKRKCWTKCLGKLPFLFIGISPWCLWLPCCWLIVLMTSYKNNEKKRIVAWSRKPKKSRIESTQSVTWFVVNTLHWWRHERSKLKWKTPSEIDVAPQMSQNRFF